MLSRILDYADRVLARVQRWVAEPAEQPAGAPAPVTCTPKAANKWESSAYHVEVLGSSVCPDCEQPKAVGSYRCKPCHEKAVTRAVA